MKELTGCKLIQQKEARVEKMSFNEISFLVWLMSWLCGANASVKEGADLFTGYLNIHQLKSFAKLQCN